MKVRIPVVRIDGKDFLASADTAEMLDSLVQRYTGCSDLHMAIRSLIRQLKEQHG